MAKIKVLVTFGTRPDAAKMAPLVKELARRRDDFETVVCTTAQHREMLDQVLSAFDLTPDFDLDLMTPRQTLSGLAQRILQAFEPVLDEVQPDIVLVHGDTQTTLMGGLISFFKQMMVGHVEAGLRTYERYAPFPEEISRQLTARLAQLHFAPTAANKANLLAERIPAESIFVTGNTVIDAIQTTVRPDYTFINPLLQQLCSSGRRLLTVTAHRRENLGQPLQEIAYGLKDIAETHDDIAICYAVHLNPAVQETVRPILSNLPNVYLTDPLELLDMHNLMARSTLILTDSGGLQEEAPALGKPVLVLRDVTERQEAVEAGTVLLIGPHRQRILSETNRLLADRDAYQQMARAHNPYGDGRACERICEALLFTFGRRSAPPAEFFPLNPATSEPIPGSSLDA
ncbi:MAG: UDP-N-acetylglucosamine 2-epimerase (non-hydrolyzing) [Symbiobacteriaceae bacterium]|nr:UDP-N-acetylglucosamine 2-epimerase (non-hydrolyzing) [Symbiobacteriaceae bacterium]